MALIASANIFNGLAEETNAPAVVEDLFAAPLPAVSSPPPKLRPSLDVRTYRIEGNTALPPETFGVLSNYAGKVDLSRVREGLDKLQSIYNDSGFSNVSVTLPEQKFTNGLIRIQIIEANPAVETDLATAITNLLPRRNQPSRSAAIKLMATPRCRLGNSTSSPITSAIWISLKCAKAWAKCNCATANWDFRPSASLCRSRSSPTASCMSKSSKAG